MTALADSGAASPDYRGLWSETLRGVVDFWCARRRGRRMPARADIDPAELRHLLPQVYLLEVLGASRYRYRLIGTTIATRLRADATGRFVDEALFGDNAPLVVEMYDYVASARVPVINRARLFWTEVSWLNYTSVVLPLSTDQASVNMMLGAMDFWISERLPPAARPRRVMDWEPLAVPPAAP